MNKKHCEIDGILLSTNGPTTLQFKQLHRWVLWQFPRHNRQGFCGAVHPPVPRHGWLPAVIDSRKKKAVIYAQADQPFRTPEAAADWLEKVMNGESG